MALQMDLTPCDRFIATVGIVDAATMNTDGRPLKPNQTRARTTQHTGGTDCNTLRSGAKTQSALQKIPDIRPIIIPSDIPMLSPAMRRMTVIKTVDGKSSWVIREISDCHTSSMGGTTRGGKNREVISQTARMIITPVACQIILLL